MSQSSGYHGAAQGLAKLSCFIPGAQKPPTVPALATLGWFSDFPVQPQPPDKLLSLLPVSGLGLSLLNRVIVVAGEVFLGSLGFVRLPSELVWLHS